jgi:hypothetical protein
MFFLSQMGKSIEDSFTGKDSASHSNSREKLRPAIFSLSAAAGVLFRLASRNTSYFGVTSCHAFHFRIKIMVIFIRKWSQRARQSPMPVPARDLSAKEGGPGGTAFFCPPSGGPDLPYINHHANARLLPVYSCN